MIATIARMGRPRKAMRTKTVRLDEGLVYKIGAIAAAHDEAAPDWLSAAIAPLIEREYEKAIKILALRRGQRETERDADN